MVRRVTQGTRTEDPAPCWTVASVLRSLPRGACGPPRAPTSAALPFWSNPVAAFLLMFSELKIRKKGYVALSDQRSHCFLTPFKLDRFRFKGLALQHLYDWQLCFNTMWRTVKKHTTWLGQVCPKEATTGPAPLSAASSSRAKPACGGRGSCPGLLPAPQRGTGCLLMSPATEVGPGAARQTQPGPPGF